MGRQTALGLLALVFALPGPAPACSICNLQGTTLRQDASQAKLVLFGKLTGSQLGADGMSGTTQFTIEKVIKSDPFLGGRKVVELPRFVPVDPKNPPTFLIFCDVFNDKLDPYRGSPVKSEAIVEYLKGSLAIDPKAADARLQHCFKYLEHRDPDVAQDAFLEVARASDKELADAAAKFSAAKLREWVQDPQMPAERLNVYAFLLGVCGTDRDAAVLRSFLQRPTERNQSAYQGILCGYVQLRPREGWDLLQDVIKDQKNVLAQRVAVMRALRFYHGWKPEETRREVLRALAAAIEQGDVADLAVEDLRRYEFWDLTPAVLAQFDKKSHDGPLVKRSIVRYALTCPRPEARAFITALSSKDGDLVREVEESLQFDKRK